MTLKGSGIQKNKRVYNAKELVKIDRTKKRIYRLIQPCNKAYIAGI